MFYLLIILLILVEILAVSWIIFFLIRLDKTIVNNNEKLVKFKKNFVPMLIEIRLKSRLLCRRIEAIKHNQKLDKIKSTLTSLADAALVLYFFRNKIKR